MGYFKFDKLDKIVISFTLIIVTMVCIFNTFCFAAAPVDINIVRNLGYNFTSNSFEYRENSSVGYFPLVVGHKYKIFNESTYASRTFRFTEDIPDVGVSSNSAFTVPISGSYEFVATSPRLFISDTTASLTSNFEFIELIDLSINGYDTVVTDLFNNVGISQLWTVFDNSIPYILVVIVFSLGFWFIKHNIIEYSKGRDF